MKRLKLVSKRMSEWHDGNYSGMSLRQLGSYVTDLCKVIEVLEEALVRTRKEIQRQNYSQAEKDTPQLVGVDPANHHPWDPGHSRVNQRKVHSSGIKSSERDSIPTARNKDR